MNLELDWIYEAIGNNELECTTLVLERIDELSIEKNTIVEPLTFDQWRYESDIDSEYDSFHGGYGDAAAAFWDYAEYHYANYLKRVKRDGKYADLFA